jgi:hypothetical protein
VRALLERKNPYGEWKTAIKEYSTVINFGAVGQEEELKND